MSTLPYTVSRFETTVEEDVTYAVSTGFRTEAPVGNPWATFRLILHQGKPKPLSLKMDIYRPEGDGDASRPLLLMMHGGSFFIGNKREAGQTGWCRYFASLGYVAVSIDYRLGFRPTRKDVGAAEFRALEDAENALAFLLGREDLGIDPGRIFIAGTSAGAITALHLAFDMDPKFPVRAVANLWGSVHDLSVLERAAVESGVFLHDLVLCGASMGAYTACSGAAVRPYRSFCSSPAMLPVLMKFFTIRSSRDW